MFTEDVLLALVKVGGLVVVCVVIIRTFGPTINLLIRKKFNLSQEGKAVQEDTVAAAMERADRATFQFRCPGGHVLEGTTDMAGQPGECPVCGVRDSRVPYEVNPEKASNHSSSSQPVMSGRLQPAQKPRRLCRILAPVGPILRFLLLSVGLCAALGLALVVTSGATACWLTYSWRLPFECLGLPFPAAPAESTLLIVARKSLLPLAYLGCLAVVLAHEVVALAREWADPTSQ
jgi:hypothetical protein